MKDLNSFPPAGWVEGKTATVFSAERLGAVELWNIHGINIASLCLIKVLVFINEVTEGSIDQAFRFMSWRFSLLSLSHVPARFRSLGDPLFNRHTRLSHKVFLSRCTRCFTHQLFISGWVSLALSLSLEIFSCFSFASCLLSLGCFSSGSYGLVLISQPVWGRVGSSSGPLNIRVKWQDTLDRVSLL